MPAITMDPMELSQKLIRCASVTPRDEGALQVLVDVLRPLGFECHVLPFGDVNNLFARRGTAGPHLCFLGHTDVVPPGDESLWSHPPFAAKIADGKLYGRGASDMKGAIAAFIAALAEVDTNNGSLSLLITGDEEGESINGTVKVLSWMRDNGHMPDAALVGEPSNPQALGDEIKIGRRGSLCGRLVVRGVQGHAAYPERADNPLPRLLRLLGALEGHVFDPGSAHFPATRFVLASIDTGNPAFNVIPAKTMAQFNLRFNDNWTAQTLGEEIRDILNAVDEKYELELISNAESFITRPGPLTDAVLGAIKEITGRTPAMTTSGGTSDARFIAPFCPVVEFGLINKTIHKIDEHAAVDDLRALTRIYRRALELYFSA